MQDYYEGFANDTLWPLYHDALRDSTYNARHWEAYQTVNQRFADMLASIAPEGAIVWIHDYHLQLVPQMLRDQRPDVIIGFFFHIPFPPVELFMRLPWRTEIAAGLAACDLVGFQRAINAANFVIVCEELLGVQPNVGSFPISIDVEELEAVAAGRATRQRSNRYRTRLGEPEVVLLGVDRLDYTKGISQRLRAYQSLLDDGTLDTERCVMVQVATPTREGVEHYQNERHEIEQLVGEINGVHGRLGYPALHYLYQSLPLDELVALYRTGDVMLVTPLRDGMNLVAKEYVTTRLDGDGVLVLSEFAGAADELTDAVLVNPHDEKALREAIVTAVEMHRHERRARMARLREVVRGSDVQGWAERFLAELHPQPPEHVTPISGAVERRAFDDPATRRGDRRRRWTRPLLVGLDVDGVLAPIVAHAADAQLLPGVLEAVAELADAHARRRRVGPDGRGSRSASGSPPTWRCSGCTAWSGATSAVSSSATTSSNGWTASARWPPTPPPWPATGPGSSASRRASSSTSARRIPTRGARSAGELLRRGRGRDRRPRPAGPRRRRAAGPLDEQGDGDGRAGARGRRPAHRVRRRRPHRRGGVRGDRRRRLLDPRRPRRDRRPPSPRRPPRGPHVPSRAARRCSERPGARPRAQ